MPVRKRSIRNLAQYKDLTDEEFNELMQIKEEKNRPIAEFEDRIEIKISQFESDYDLSDLKFNDHQQLRSLAQSLITLEDLEMKSYQIRMEGIDENSVSILNNIGRQISQLKADVSKLQDDLKITRKIRKGDKETTILSELDILKQKAKAFYESKMSYIFCPKCSMLLSTAWFLYPENTNRIKLKCGRELENGDTCDGEVSISSKELLDNSNTNKPNILPESML